LPAAAVGSEGLRGDAHGHESPAELGSLAEESRVDLLGSGASDHRRWLRARSAPPGPRRHTALSIISCVADKRLIVSGPGTGKTFTFQEALKATGAKGLALTFIRNLVTDLTDSLDELADVYSFHGFCKHLMHQHDVAGLNDGDYYPPLFLLLVHDIFLLSGDNIDTRDVELHFHDLAEQDGLIARVLERADYYTAVSHTDLVYRVLRHFEAVPNAIPTYPLIVVDEIQDFSQQETEFITLLSSRNKILAAGDDDQALYVGLKHAMPAFIRGLATGNEYDCFELPYCSRCTHVVVAAVNDVVTAATAAGYLVDRLPKNFSCYTPDKGQDSEDHPTIIHAKCSTENSPYAGRYITQQIARIPAADVERSRKGKYPTVLVIGPNPFLNRAFKEVLKTFPNARMKTGSRSEIDLLDGYRRLAFKEASRLGWRIVIAAAPFTGDDAVFQLFQSPLEGEFSFTGRNVSEDEVQVDITMPAISLLMESVRLQDELPVLKERIPDPDQVFRHKATQLQWEEAETVELAATVWARLKKGASANDLHRDIPRCSYHLYRTLVTLMDSGQVA
jgi:hypothetical protein